MSERTAEIFEELGWFHSGCTKDRAETLLMLNGQGGSYLIRRSSLPGEYFLSVRFENSVKHFNMVWNGKKYVLGSVSFSTTEELLIHFFNHPFIAVDSGITTQLMFPYPNMLTEPARGATNTPIKSATIPMTPSKIFKEGFMTKLGGIVKSWKKRWFVLDDKGLSYYRDRNGMKPLRTLKLADCCGCTPDETVGKKNCFKLEFSWRTFYLFSDSQEEMEEWINVIKWKLENQEKLAKDYRKIRGNFYLDNTI